MQQDLNVAALSFGTVLCSFVSAVPEGIYNML